MITRSQFSSFPGLRRKPGLAEIEALLDLLPNPALLIDLLSQRLLLANAQALALTAYTRAELLGNSFSSFFKDAGSASFLAAPAAQPVMETLVLSRRNKPNLDVQVIRTDLTPRGQWALLLLEPVHVLEKRHAEHQRHSEIQKSMENINGAFAQTDLEAAIQMALQGSQQITGARLLSVYLQDVDHSAQDLKLERFSHLGPEEILPTQLPVQELVALRTHQFWTPGKRPISGLHRAARAAGLTYVATAPLGPPQALIGFFMLAGDQLIAPEGLDRQIKLLADAVSTLLESHSRFSGLQANLEAELHRSVVFNLIENSVDDGVIVLSPDLTIQRMNRSAERTLGYSSLEAHGRQVSDILITTGSLKPALNLALEGIQTLRDETLNLYRRSGQAFHARMSFIPSVENGQVHSIVILFQDLTDQEQIEVQAQQLEQRALLGEVTAIFAHEVRNPINNISTGLQLMAINLGEADPNQELITRLQQDCDRLSELMKSVLAFSRPTEFEMEAVDLGLLIGRLLDRLRPRLANSHVQPHLQVEPGLPPVRGNMRALEQVFVNLITNAIQAMSENGGTVALKVQLVKGQSERRFVEVSVADNGPGIPKEILDRLFQPFFTTKSDGTGLGLAITKRIVTAHRGSIRVNSFPGGTLFQVRLPLMEGK